MVMSRIEDHKVEWKCEMVLLFLDMAYARFQILQAWSWTISI